MRTGKVWLFILLFLWFLWSCHPYNSINVYDGFELPDLSSVWATTKFLPGAVEIQSKVARYGSSAAKITLHPGDQIESEKGTRYERAELLEKEKLWAVEDSAYTYSFSIFIPYDFPVIPTRLVIAQWKQYCKFTNCSPDNPVIAVRYSSGELTINVQVSEQKIILFSTKEDIRNKWSDFRFQIRFSGMKSGFIKTWLNNTHIIDYNGLTAYPISNGYPDKGRFYFKTGLYRDRTDQTMVIYIDEYRKQLLN